MKINKFIVIILLLFLIINVFSINTYAYDFTDINDKKQSIPDLPSDVLEKNFVLSEYVGSYTIWVMSDKTGYFYIDNNYVYASINPVARYEYNAIYEEWRFKGNQYLSSGSSDWIKKENFSYSNIIVFSNKEKDNVFFPLPQTVLGRVTMKAEIMKEMKTTMVGFLKYLIVFLVSLIAFYKGWQLLLRQLRKA